MFISMVVSFDLELDQLDVKATFLHGLLLAEMIYMKQPLGCVEKGKEDLYSLLNKSIYGMRDLMNISKKLALTGSLVIVVYI